MWKKRNNTKGEIKMTATEFAKLILKTNETAGGDEKLAIYRILQVCVSQINKGE